MLAITGGIVFLPIVMDRWDDPVGIDVRIDIFLDMHCVVFDIQVNFRDYIPIFAGEHARAEPAVRLHRGGRGGGGAGRGRQGGNSIDICGTSPHLSLIMLGVF